MISPNSRVSAPSGAPRAEPEPGLGTATRRARWIVFACQEQAFGLGLDRVRETLPPQPFTRLPGADAAACGLMGLRGRVLTVFDFGSAFGLRAARGAADPRILLVDAGARTFGLVVEVVLGVVRNEAPLGLDAAALARLDAGRDDVRGIGEMDDGRPFVAVDLDRLLGRLLA